MTNYFSPVKMSGYLESSKIPDDIRDDKLIRAIEENDLTTFRYIVDQRKKLHISIDPVLPYKKTPLYIAVERQRPEMVRELLNEGANPNVYPHLFVSLFRAAIIWGNTEIIQMLIDSGANINHISIDFQTPLSTAIKYKKYEIAEDLIKRGANVHVINHLKYNLLHHAVDRGNINLIKLLIDKGVNVHQQNKLGLTALQMARQNGQTEIVNLILKKYHEDGMNNLRLIGGYFSMIPKDLTSLITDIMVENQP